MSCQSAPWILEIQGPSDSSDPEPPLSWTRWLHRNELEHATTNPSSDGDRSPAAEPPDGPPSSARRLGYLVSVGINAAIWFALNTWPGWMAVPFLTAETAQVHGWVNVSIVVPMVANLVYLVTDPRWLRALGELLAAAVSLLALTAVWRVFPFAFGGSEAAVLIARTALVVGIAGCAIAIVVHAATLVRSLRDRVTASLHW